MTKDLSTTEISSMIPFESSRDYWTLTGSRRTSTRLHSDAPCKIFGLEDGQSGAEPRVESEVDARAQQVLHYVRIRCYTPPHTHTAQRPAPLHPLVEEFSLSFSLSLSLPVSLCMCRGFPHDVARTRESIAKHTREPYTTPPHHRDSRRTQVGEMRTRRAPEKERKRKTVNATASGGTAEAHARASSSSLAYQRRL